MRAVHFPYDGNNPYQRCLGEGLRSLGVTVEAGRVGRLLPLRELGWSGRGADVVHLHWLKTMLTAGSHHRTLVKGALFVLHLRRLRRAGTRIAWTAHNLEPHEPRFARAERRFRSRVARLSHAVFVHCEAAREAVVRHLQLPDDRNVVTIRHGHYIGAYPNDVGRDEARRALRLPPEAPMILCLGQIRAYKGVPDLVAAFGRLQSREARLVIAGKIVDSGFGDELRAMVSGNADIRLDEGFVEDERLQLYANAADVAVFPYHDILTSGAVVLAMSFGLPCVAPRLGCIGEYLDERGAFFFEPRSVTGLAEAIDRALARRAELPAMGRANLALASEWDWEGIARETLEGYRR